MQNCDGPGAEAAGCWHEEKLEGSGLLSKSQPRPTAACSPRFLAVPQEPARAPCAMRPRRPCPRHCRQRKTAGPARPTPAQTLDQTSPCQRPRPRADTRRSLSLRMQRAARHAGRDEESNWARMASTFETDRTRPGALAVAHPSREPARALTDEPAHGDADRLPRRRGVQRPESRLRPSRRAQ